MPYIQPPVLPEKDLPLPFEDVLAHHLRTQLLQHREAVSKFDLSGFEGQPQRNVEMKFGAPKWQMEELASPVIAHYLERGEDAESLKKRAEDTIAYFIGKSKSDGWTVTRRQGDTTVVFSEAIGDEQSPANPERALPKNLAFEPYVAFTSINGRGVTFEETSLMRNALPNLVKWMDAAKQVEGDGLLDFHPVIEIGNISSVGLYPSKTLFIGEPFLSEFKDKGMMLDILRHERGHYLNGDLDPTSERSKIRIEQLVPVDTLFQTMGEIAEYISNPTKIEGMDHQQTIKGIRALGDELIKAMDRVSLLADRVRSYEGYDELSPLSVAADMDNGTSLLKHISTLPAFDLFGFNMEKNTLLESRNERKEAKKCDPRLASYPSEELLETRQVLMEQIGRITPQHKADFDVAEQTFQNVSKAREYLADIHAAQHSEDPSRLHRVFEKLHQDFGEGGGRHHPDNPERTSNARHFSDRVLFQREQAAKETKDGQTR